VQPEQARRRRTTPAYIVCEQGVRLVCKPEGCELRDIRLLNDIVSVYKGQADIFRASNDVWEIQAPYYPGITALVIFPRLQPADILQAARNEERIPSGISRHIIPNRALNTNILTCSPRTEFEHAGGCTAG
jgi:hypothetical protein